MIASRCTNMVPARCRQARYLGCSPRDVDTVGFRQVQLLTAGNDIITRGWAGFPIYFPKVVDSFTIVWQKSDQSGLDVKDKSETKLDGIMAGMTDPKELTRMDVACLGQRRDDEKELFINFTETPKFPRTRV